MSKKPLTKTETNNNIKNTEIKDKRTGAWTQALVTLVFILIPALFIWIFLSHDFFPTNFNGRKPLTLGELWAIAIAFVVYSILIIIFLVWIQLIWIDTINFTLPISIVLMAILLSQDIATWGRALIVIALIFTALPVNMMTVRYIEHKISQKNK